MCFLSCPHIFIKILWKELWIHLFTYPFSLVYEVAWRNGGTKGILWIFPGFLLLLVSAIKRYIILIKDFLHADRRDIAFLFAVEKKKLGAWMCILGRSNKISSKEDLLHFHRFFLQWRQNKVAFSLIKYIHVFKRKILLFISKWQK